MDFLILTHLNWWGKTSQKQNPRGESSMTLKRSSYPCTKLDFLKSTYTKNRSFSSKFCSSGSLIGKELLLKLRSELMKSNKIGQDSDRSSIPFDVDTVWNPSRMTSSKEVHDISFLVPKGDQNPKKTRNFMKRKSRKKPNGCFACVAFLFWLSTTISLILSQGKYFQH
jgi:hypothetical protein